MLWVHCLVGVSHFAKFCKKNGMRNKNLLFRSGEDNGKMIQNPRANPDQHQEINCF